MKKKILITILTLILCAGCKVKYNITISEDGKVEESALITEDADFFARYENSSVGRVIGFIIEPHLDKLNENKYVVNNHITSSDSGVIVKKEYENIDEYINNNIFYSQFSNNKMTHTEDKNKVTLSIKGNFSKLAQDQERIYIPDATVSITIPYKVLDNNADKVSGNVYTWNFDDDSQDEREIRIVYDKNKLKGHSSVSSVLVFLIITIALLVLLFFVYNNIKSKRENVNKI